MSSLNARLAALEMKVGIVSSAEHVPAAEQHHQQEQRLDIPGRIDALQATVDKAHSSTTDLRTTWQESLALLQELDPGQGLTYQQQPLMYKRQEILAVAPQLKQDFHHLSTLVGLLHNTQQNGRGGMGSGGKNSNKNPLTADSVTQAPLLTTVKVPSLEDQRRLDALRVQIEDLNGRTRTMTTRLHQMLEVYHAIMTAASEKCILADEVLSMREAKTF